MPGKVFIDTNIVIYALGKSSSKTAQVAPLFANHLRLGNWHSAVLALRPRSHAGED